MTCLSKKQPMIVEELHRNRHKLRVKYSSANLTQELFICSDVHFDSKKCARELFTKHLKEAEKRKAFVVINGDFYDLMQGRYDPRGGKYNIRPEYKHANYIDCVINDGANFLGQFDLTYFIGQGNHETNILKRLETNPIERLVERMNYRKQGSAYMGGYSGWLRFAFEHEGGGNRMPYTIHYHHGYGGNAPRSKGLLKVDINQMQYPDADMLIRGHDHNKWHVPVTVKRLTHGFDEKECIVDHLQTGSYKGTDDRFAGWEIEKGFNEPTMGGYFVTLRPNMTNMFVDVTITDAR